MQGKRIWRLVLATALAGALVPLWAMAGASPASAAASPPGANNWSCRPTAAHPRPVVLVHGTFANQYNTWLALSPLLARQGYCVFALDYGGAPGSPIEGTGPIESSAAQLAAFVNKVLVATGAGQVDIVGHSQGGMMPRYYLRFLGGAAKVHRLVGLSPSNHGTTIDGIVTLFQLLGLQAPGAAALAAVCPACAEQLVGSGFLRTLNAGGDTVPGVRYVVIETRYDEVVTPYTSAFLSGTAVQNITLQDACPLDLTEHIGITSDPAALRYVLNALDPVTARPPACIS
jgi:triacylglycerol esterase/lipase EstA (alpha/beta hydrolase family)